MPYQKAVELIERDPSKAEKRSCSEIAKENARTISRLVYETFPTLDNDSFMDLRIVEVRGELVAEMTKLPYGYFAFTCKNDGSIRYYQARCGDNDSYYEEDYEKYPGDKVVIQHIKRKRFPRK